MGGGWGGAKPFSAPSPNRPVCFGCVNFGQSHTIYHYTQRQNSGFRPRLELPNPSGPGVQTIQFSVPGNKCGLIIGKGERDEEQKEKLFNLVCLLLPVPPFVFPGGDTIRQIQVQSGAHVELHRGAQPNPEEKLFNVRGTPQQIQLAQQLIRQKYEAIPGAPAPQFGYVCYKLH